MDLRRSSSTILALILAQASGESSKYSGSRCNSSSAIYAPNVRLTRNVTAPRWRASGQRCYPWGLQQAPLSHRRGLRLPVLGIDTAIPRRLLARYSLWNGGGLIS